MTKVRIVPYKAGSKSARFIRDSLEHDNVKLVKRDSTTRRLVLPSNRVNGENTLIVNWGASTVPNWWNGTVDKRVNWRLLNNFLTVGLMANKLYFFEMVKNSGFGNLVPEFYTNREDAQTVFDAMDTGIESRYKILMQRNVLTGHSGDGIIPLYADNPEHQLTSEGKLWVRYLPKQHEYRLHFFKKPDGITYDLFIQQKRKINDDGIKHSLIRSYQNGYIFAVNDIKYPNGYDLGSVFEKFKEFIELSGLDFGAIDIIYNHNQRRFYMLEINSAPGILGDSTQNFYLNNIEEHVNGF